MTESVEEKVTVAWRVEKKVSILWKIFKILGDRANTETERFPRAHRASSRDGALETSRLEESTTPPQEDGVRLGRESRLGFSVRLPTKAVKPESRKGCFLKRRGTASRDGAFRKSKLKEKGHSFRKSHLKRRQHHYSHDEYFQHLMGA